MINFTSDSPLEATLDEYARTSGEFHNEAVSFVAQLPEERVCENCSAEVHDRGPAWVHTDNETLFCVDDDEDSIASPAPTAPGNWVGFEIDPEKGQTSVQLSIGDPRSCVEMVLRRWKNPDTGRDELLLHLPHANGIAQHVELHELHPGTFIVR